MNDGGQNLWPLLLSAIGQTLEMVLATLAIGGIAGLVLGTLLYASRPGNLLANRGVYMVLNLLVNIVRPIPFIIFITTVLPLTVRVTGASYGTRAVIFPMAVMATFATSRIVEQNLVALDPGVIEAARAMGAGPLRIVWTVVVREALAPLILGYTFLFVAITDMSAIASSLSQDGWEVTRGHDRGEYGLDRERCGPGKVDRFRVEQPLDLKSVHHRDDRFRCRLDLGFRPQVLGAAHLFEGLHQEGTKALEARLEPGLTRVGVRHRLRREHGVSLDDPGTVHVRAGRGDEVAEQFQPGRRLMALEMLDVGPVAILQHLDQQLVLGTEVMQHPGVGDAHLLRDLDQGALVVAPGPERRHRRPQDLLAASHSFGTGSTCPGRSSPRGGRSSP